MFSHPFVNTELQPGLDQMDFDYQAFRQAYPAFDFNQETG